MVSWRERKKYQVIFLSLLNNDQLTLRYTDRPQQKFIYHFGRYEDERYIRKGKYYFVKQ